MNKQIKTCERCGGSGNYSFNLTHGTVCFGCNGRGTVTVDVAAEAKRKAAAAKRNSIAEAKRASVIAATAVTVTKFNNAYGPFAVDTQIGVELLNKKVFITTGKTIWEHRDALL
jgi:DnaJ-class molecular chaperone